MRGRGLLPRGLSLGLGLAHRDDGVEGDLRRASLGVLLCPSDALGVAYRYTGWARKRCTLYSPIMLYLFNSLCAVSSKFAA